MYRCIFLHIFWVKFLLHKAPKLHDFCLLFGNALLIIFLKIFVFWSAFQMRIL